jgi:hypothetical protein
LLRQTSGKALSRDGHQKKAHWQSGGKCLTLFSWAHAQKQEAARRSADGKGPSADGKVPPADSKGPSADGKGPSADSKGPSADSRRTTAGADKASPPPSQHQSNGLLGEHLLSIMSQKGEPFYGMYKNENGWENILRVSSYSCSLQFQL